MESQVEKLYENAGINYEERYNNCTLNKEAECKLECSCDICKYSEEKYIYPPFTAEKQLAILQLLTQQCDLTISHFTEWEFIHYDGQEPTQVTGEDFAETFAKLINDYWQSLTEEEKQQVKNILQ